ncbi:MAG TPA: YciI family protein [Propionibacteriaceae bacterium]|nr:YciI family protein [Propionibacteriaceae bacterium]
MTQYLLSLYQPEGPAPSPEVLEPIMREVNRVDAEMRSAGAWVFAGGLCPPSTATVVRPQGADELVTDGPFAEAKEHLGGFTVVSAPDLDAALEWGRKLAQASGLPIEVRPFQGGSQPQS